MADNSRRVVRAAAWRASLPAQGSARGKALRGGLSAWFASLLLCIPLARAQEMERGDVEIRGVALAEGESESYPGLRARIAWELRKRTSIAAAKEAPRLRFDDRRIFDGPLLYWNGRHAFASLSESERRGLRRFIALGGFLWIDAPSGAEGFDRSLRRELRRAFPSHPLQTLDRKHTIFHSFYLLEHAQGRDASPKTLEAIQVEGRAAIVYSRNDVGAALARDAAGQPLLPMVEGGERGRELAARLAVNLVMYALCLDYKDDQVHLPFILKRLRGASRKYGP